MVLSAVHLVSTSTWNGPLYDALHRVEQDNADGHHRIKALVLENRDQAEEEQDGIDRRKGVFTHDLEEVRLVGLQRHHVDLAVCMACYNLALSKRPLYM